MKRPTVTIRVSRVQLAGNVGTAYDVLVPTTAKAYRPIAYSQYATVVCPGNGKHYYRMMDALRTPTIDEAPDNTPEQIDARVAGFKRVEKLGARLAAKIAKRAFPELRGHRTLPSLWAPWSLPTATKYIKARLDLNALIEPQTANS